LTDGSLHTEETSDAGKLAGDLFVYAATKACHWEGFEHASASCQQMLNENIFEESIGMDIFCCTMSEGIYSTMHAAYKNRTTQDSSCTRLCSLLLLRLCSDL
jgi:hypothetical protein